MDNKQIFRTMSYIRHNQRRLEHLSSFKFDLHNKKILELGAGIGDHTHFYLDRKCKVISLEAREENVEVLKKEFIHENVKIYKHNLEEAFYEAYKNDLQDVDFIHCYGLLYHLKNPLTLIKECSKLSNSILLLETCVSYGTGENLNLCIEQKDLASQSFSGEGCRPSREWVFNNLKRNYKYVYMSISQPNHREFPLDWHKKDEDISLSRAVFVASNKEIFDPQLVPFVVNKHTRSV
jgi:hypothetical protein